MQRRQRARHRAFPMLDKVAGEPKEDRLQLGGLVLPRAPEPLREAGRRSPRLEEATELDRTALSGSGRQAVRFDANE